jgi:DNA polymerase-3 subunit epsilon
MNTQDRNASILTARAWMSQRALFLDTETTGLEPWAQAVEIVAVDKQGLVQFSALVKPTIAIPASATQVHGIDQAMIADACGFDVIGPKLLHVLTGADIVITYNAQFDLRILQHSGHAAGVVALWPRAMFGCAMHLFAQFNGEKNALPPGGYRWKSLGAAMRLCNIPLPNTLHRAAADAEACRLVVKFMAEREAG